MGNKEQLAIIRKGTIAWNVWRQEHPDSRPDLDGANLTEPNLSFANLTGADLSGADLVEAHLTGANLSGADLTGAYLTEANLLRANLLRANLSGAHLSGACLIEANIFEANLVEADLRGADLREANLGRAHLGRAKLGRANLSRANLDGAQLVNTCLVKANLTGCRVYGISAWDLDLKKATQKNLIITRKDEPEITVDHLEVAQFIYLLLNNEKIRDVIDTTGKKGVLLLGRFTGGRLAILERLRNELRRRGFLPMVFNFDKPETKDFIETVRILVGLSRFVIADITKPRSTPFELSAVVPEYMVPFVTILEKGEEPFAMFQDLLVKYRDWVFAPISYADVDELVRGLDDVLIERAQKCAVKLIARKAVRRMRVTRMQDVLPAPVG